MVVVATTAPPWFTARSACERPEIAKPEVVAFVTVALEPVKFCKVVEPRAR